MDNRLSSHRWLLAIVACLAALALEPRIARAEIVTSDEMTVPTPADAERAKVQSFLEQATVVQKLQTMGINSIDAKDRVAAMSQEEVHALAQRIDTLPAGGNLGTTDYILILLAVILVIIII